MKKNFKFILFTFIFALICPIVFFACGEVPFEDVPYTGSGASLEDVVTGFNSSGEYMVNNIKLKTKFETTNTYTFYNTQTSSAKVVKDVIITTFGSLNDNPTIITVDTTRYVNNIKMYNTVNTYVQPSSLETETPYCYSFSNSFTGNEEVIDRDRNEYNPNIQSAISFYNSTIYEIKQDEVCSIQQKEFEGVTYYKLNSGVTTLEAVNNRFYEQSETDTLEDNPQLFKMITKRSHDAAENYYYECAKNSSNYASYFKIHYNLKNNERETYLNVVSVTKLTGYGENVNVTMPEDVNEYVANSFMKSMQKSASYITYTTTEPYNEDNNYGEEPSSKIAWTVVKLGDDYSIRKDEISGTATNNTTLYYLLKTSESDYTTYMLSEGKLVKPEALDLELLHFNFAQNFLSKNENMYQFGNEENSVTVTFSDNNIYSLETYSERNELVIIYIESYGEDFTKLPLSFITSTSDYEIVA